MNDLMELIKSCSAAPAAKRPNYAFLDKAAELGLLGFEALSQKIVRTALLAEKMECIAQEKYPVITPAKIQKFVNALAEQYNANHKRKTVILNDHVITYSNPPSGSSGGLWTLLRDQWRQNGEKTTSGAPTTITATTCDAMSTDPGSIGAYKWLEVPISEYLAIPPDAAIQALKKAQSKEIFDSFTIASVLAVKDPLLLGRIDGVEDRYFLCQWGDDVSLDDVI